MALFHLTNADINAMLAGKIGACRKLTVIIDSFKSSAAAECSSQSSDTATNSASLTETEPSVTASLTPIVDGQGTRVTMPLPMYSTRIKDVLEKGNVLVDLDLFIEETAYHVIAHGDMKSKEEYDDFGRRLVAAYPCLEFSEKKTKWVRFHCFFFARVLEFACLQIHVL